MKTQRFKIDETICSMIEQRHFEANAAQETMNRLMANGKQLPAESVNHMFERITEFETGKAILMEQIRTEFQPEGAIRFEIDFSAKEVVFYFE